MSGVPEVAWLTIAQIQDGLKQKQVSAAELALAAVEYA
jgi:hypothetical protein